MKVVATPEEVDSCEYLYLRDIGEPHDQCLRIVVEEARGQSHRPSRSPERQAQWESLGLDKVFGETRPIESDADCRTFEVIWDRYVAYCVQDESFMARDDSEVGEGRWFTQLTQSPFLEFVARRTYALSIWPNATLVHWRVGSLNHIVDVATLSITGPPSLHRLK